MKIELTFEQIKNLKIFLGRTDLKGAEVAPFLEIMKAIEKGVAEEDGK